MRNLLKVVLILSFSLFHSLLLAKECPEIFGRYGDGRMYNNLACRLFVNAFGADSNSSFRSFTFNEEGQIQVFVSFPKSTAARVYYIFPFRMEKSIDSVDKSHISVTHPSGVRFEFDKKGIPSSPDLTTMKVLKESTPENKSGIELGNYKYGLVVDLGYKENNTPILDKDATVTITDKNNDKCTFSNSEFHQRKTIKKDEAELKYKTNKTLHAFLAKKCPKLDISDLLAPAPEKYKRFSKPTIVEPDPLLEVNRVPLGAAPLKLPPSQQDNTARKPKDPPVKKYDDFKNLLDGEKIPYEENPSEKK